ncbi:MAG: VOC family protein [Clostridiales bacterium]|jgi:catechol 2,3-dioxygenase-like lactoylglutathione lyase family enzyme|nr:VOC family protein [Clostridiales bacterium]
MSGVVGTNLVAQVGFIVKDIEAAKTKWAEFLGLPVPPTVGGGDYAITQVRYKGAPAPDAQAKLAFFNVGRNFQLELIEPNESPSTWREFLDKHGEGVHHLAFQVKGMKNAVASCEAFGMTLEQTGEYGDGSGRYAYLAAEEQLKVLIELLENDKA